MNNIMTEDIVIRLRDNTCFGIVATPRKKLGLYG
jgi:hypothetical protein